LRRKRSHGIALGAQRNAPASWSAAVLCRLGMKRRHDWRLSELHPRHSIALLRGRDSPEPFVTNGVSSGHPNRSACEGGTGLPHSTTLARPPKPHPFSKPLLTRTVLSETPALPGTGGFDTFLPSERISSLSLKIREFTGDLIKELTTPAIMDFPNRLRKASGFR